MFRLRHIFLAIACCLALAVPAQAGMQKDTASDCRAMKVAAAERSDSDQAKPESESAIAMCITVQAIAPRETFVPSLAMVAMRAPVAQDIWTIARRPSGIERPPRV